MRLDKALSQSGEYSRKEAGKLIRSGQVKINDVLACKVDIAVKDTDIITLSNEVIERSPYVYLIMNKSEGLVTAATDSREKTVMDALPVKYIKRDVRPVGRLDKDTTGLLLFTNHGALAHRLLSPKHHVEKCYYTVVSGKLEDSSIERFAEGVELSDFVTKPAKMKILEVSNEQSSAEITIVEGKFHQVKRMFHAIGHEVLTLERIKFGTLCLPEDLARGQWRILNEKEQEMLLAVLKTEGKD